MSKVKIFLSKPLVVNMGKDQDGQQINLNLPQGLQEVDQEVAEIAELKQKIADASSSDNSKDADPKAEDKKAK